MYSSQSDVVDALYIGKLDGSPSGRVLLRPGQYRIAANGRQIILPSGFYSVGFYCRMTDSSREALNGLDVDCLPSNWASTYDAE